MANVLNTLNYGLAGISGKSGSIQFMDDGSFVFRPVASGALELVGFLQLDQQAAPAVAPSGSTRLYFDTSLQILQQSIAGGAFTALAVSSLNLGGGSITISAAGAITATTAAAQALTLNGAASSSIVLSSTGGFTVVGATGVPLTISGGNSPQSNFTIGIGGGIGFNGQSSSSVIISLAGAVNITPATGQLSTVTNFTSGVGTAWWVLPGGPGAPIGATSPQAAVAAANNVRVIKVYIPTTFSVTKISFQISTASAGNFVSVALYSTDGNTKIIDSGATSTTGTGIQTKTITATLVPAGFYFLAFTGDNTVQQLEAVTVEPATGGTLVIGLLNASAVQMGTAANASAAGVMPATLGALTAVNTVAGTQWPVVVLQ